MPVVEARIEIEAPVADVFDLAQDYDLRLRWDPFLREMRFRDGAIEAAPGVFSPHFADFQAAIRYIVPQNAALRSLPTTGQWCLSSISVEATLDHARSCRLVAPLELEPRFAELVEHAELFALRVAGVQFAVVGEEYSAR